VNPPIFNTTCRIADPLVAGTSYTAADIIVFITSVAMSSCVGVNQFFNPNGRWKALRSATQNLQSIIWKFRARVDVFEYDSSNPNEASALFHSIVDKVQMRQKRFFPFQRPPLCSTNDQAFRSWPT
jgi:hypothetical protein